MAAPIVQSDEELFQLTGSWEAAAALRDEQYNALNDFNNSQPAAPAAVVETPAAVAETPAAVEETAAPTPDPIDEPTAPAEEPAAPTGIATLTTPAAVEEPAPVYTPPSRGGKLDLEPADEDIAPPVAPVAPVAPTGIATLAPETLFEEPTGVAALAPTTPTAPVVTPTKTPANQLSGVILAGASWMAGDEKTNLAKEAFGENVTNTAIGGQKTSDVLNQLNVFERDGGTFAPGTTVVLDIGANDIAQGVDEATIRANLNEIVSRLGNSGVKVILSGQPEANSYDEAIKSTNLQMDDLYSDIAKDNSNVTLVDAMSGMLNDKTLMDESGFHLNSDEAKSAYLNKFADAYKGLNVADTTAVDNKSATTAPTGIAALASTTTPETPTGVATLAPTTAKPPEATPPIDTAAAAETLKKQILGQNLTTKWKGEGLGSAEANAADMAKIMASIGITDIKDFGKVPLYEPVQEIGKTYNGQTVRTQYNEDGTSENYIFKGTGQYDQDGNETSTVVYVPKDAKLEPLYGQDVGGEFTQVDPSKVTIKDGKAVVATGETFGNKKTGQQVPNTYSERQTGNFFGGTFAGKGNTGYGVQFDAQGNPIFYTQGASSNDLANLMADLGPIGQIGLAIATGGLSIPQQIAANLAISVLSGKDIGDAIKGAAVSFVGSQIPGLDAVKDGASFIKDLGLSPEITKTLTNSFQNAVTSGGTALLTGKDVGDAMIKGAATGGVNGAVSSLVGNIDGFSDLTKNQQNMVTNAVTGVISGKPLDQIVINTAIATANAAIADANKTKSTDVVDTLTKAGLTNTGATSSTEDALTKAGLVNTDVVTTPSNLATKDIISSITGDGTTTKIDNNITSILQNAGLTQDDEFSGVDAAVAATAKANNTSIGNTEADTLEEATALAKSRNPTGTQFTYGGKTYNMTPSDSQVQSALTQNKIDSASNFNDAFKIARDNLGAGKTFTYNGKEYSTATAAERPDLSGLKTTTLGTTSVVNNYVNDKLIDNLKNPEFNPADLTKDEMTKFVSTYANATDAQKATLLKGADSMTFKVIDTLLKQTAALNPTGAGDVAVPAGTPELKAWDKGSIATAVDVAKTAGNIAAADIAGLGVRGAQFLGDLMGQDTDSFANVQNLLVNDKDKSMSKLVGNEKVVAGGIASGIESAVAFTLGGPMAGVATIAGVVANNSWVEGSKAGLSVEDNAKRTAAITALEVAGEMLGIPGMKAIMKGIPITGSVSEIVNTIKRVGGGLISENATELLTTVAQFGVDKFASFGLSKDATFDDFQTALKDTIIATTAAVGSSSGIATATRAASGVKTKEIADADRTAVSPDTSLLTSGSSFGAKVGDTSNQGLNQVTSEAIDFNKLDSSGQTSILDSLRSTIANVGLSAALTLGGVGSANAAGIDSNVTNTIQQAVSAGTDVNSAIDTSVNNSISSAINNKVNPEAAINSAVSSAISSAATNNVNTTSAINSAVTSAVNTAASNNANTTVAITSAVNSAVTTAINTSTANNTITNNTVNNVVNTAVNSAVAAAVNNNVNITTAVNTAVTAAVTAAVTNNVSTTSAVAAAVAAVTNLNVNVQAVTQLATNVANSVVVPSATVTTPVATTPPVTPTTPVTPVTPVTPTTPPVIPTPPVVPPPVVPPPVVPPPVVPPPVVPPPVVPPPVVPPVVKPPVVKPPVVKPPVKTSTPSFSMPEAQAIAATFGVPQLANVFYYGKDFGSKKQSFDKKGKLEQEEYDPLSVTQAGAAGELMEDIAEEKKNKENNANDALDLILGESSNSMSIDDILNIVKGG